VDDPESAVVAPWPHGEGQPTDWQPGKLEEHMYTETNIAAQTRVGGLTENGNFIHVTIRKHLSFGDGDRPYQVWINGLLAEPEGIGIDLVYTLPAFTDAYAVTLENGEIHSCVNPVAISMLLERGAKPPDHVTVSTSQLYRSSSNDNVPDGGPPLQIDENANSTVLLPSRADGGLGSAVVVPYPSFVMRDPFIVINDVRARRRRNAKKFKALVLPLVAVLISFVFGIPAGTLTTFAFLTPITNVLNTLLAINQFGGGAAAMINAYFQFSMLTNALNTFMAYSGTFATAVQQNSASVIQRVLSAPRLAAVEGVQYTLVELTSVLNNISTGASATDRKSRVLVSWLVESTRGDTWSWLQINFGNVANFATRPLGYEFFPQSGPILMGGCELEILKRRTLEQRIVVTVVDHLLCETRPVRLIFKSVRESGLRAGVVHSTLSQDVAKLEEALESFDRVMDSSNISTKTDDAAIDVILGLESGSIHRVRGIDVVDGLDLSISNRAAFFAGMSLGSREKLKSGAVKLRTSVLDSQSLHSLKKYANGRVGMSAMQNKVPVAKLTSRALPQHLRIGVVLRPSSVAATGSEIAILQATDNDDDNEAATNTDGDVTGESSLVSGELRPVHRAAVKQAGYSHRVVSELVPVFQSGPRRLAHTQFWTSSGIPIFDSLVGSDYQSLRRNLGVTHSPFCVDVPMDVVEKLVDHSRCVSENAATAAQWVGRRDGGDVRVASLFPPHTGRNAPEFAAISAAAAAFSDLVVQAQLDRSLMPAEIAVMESVAGIVDARSNAVVSLFDAFVFRTNNSKQPDFRMPTTNDLTFVAMPGGRELFGLLRRLGLLRRRPSSIFDTDTGAVPLSLACREFVSVESFERSEIHIARSLHFPVVFSILARIAIEAFKRVTRARLEVKMHVPVMASFVMSETSIELVRDGGAWSRRVEAVAAIESVVAFASGFLDDDQRRARVVGRVGLEIVATRPVLLFHPELYRQQPRAVSPDVVAAIRNARRVDSPPSGNYSTLKDTVSVLRTRNARHSTSAVEGFLLASAPAQVPTRRRTTNAAIDHVVDQFQRQVNVASPFTTTATTRLLVPFGAGDNTLRPLRFPVPTAMLFDTVPIHIATLQYIINQTPLFSTSTSGVLIVTIFDRSPTLKETGNGAGDPYGVHLNSSSDESSLTSLKVSVVLSVTSPFFGVDDHPTAFLPDLIDLNNADDLLNRLIRELGDGQVRNSSKVRYSEIVWNAERIVQGALAALGEVESNDGGVDAPLIVAVERPVGWVASSAECETRKREIRDAEDAINSHTTQRLDIVGALFDSLWNTVIVMRRGESSLIPRNTNQGILEQISDAFDADFGASAAHAPDLFAGHEAVPTGVGPSPPDDDGLTVDDMARIENRPSNAHFDVNSTEENLTVDQFFESVESFVQLRDILVTRFLAFVASNDVFASEEAFDFYNSDASAVAKNELEKAFDNSYTDLVATWKEQATKLAETVSEREASLQKWVQNVCMRSATANDAFVFRFHVSVLLAQSILLQTLGKGASPQLRLVEPGSAPYADDACARQRRPDSTVLRNKLTHRTSLACVSCTRQGVKWLSLGELVRILELSADAMMDTKAETCDGDDDVDGDDNDDEGGPAVYPVVPRGLSDGVGIFTSSSLSLAKSPSGWATLTTPVIGIERMTTALVVARPVLVPFAPGDVLRQVIGQVILDAYKMKSFAILRSFAEPFPISMLRPWAPARMGQQFLVRDAFQAVLAAEYVNLMSTTAAGVLQWLARAFASVRRDGTVLAIQQSALVGGDDDVDAIVNRCSLFGEGTLKAELCVLLRRLGFVEQNPDGDLITFRPTNDDSRELRFQSTDFASILESHAMLDVQEAIDSLFGLVDGYGGGAQWIVDEGAGEFSRPLPSPDDIVNMRAARRVAATMITRISLTTGIRATLVFAFLIPSVYGLAIILTMDGRDVAETGESLLAMAGGSRGEVVTESAARVFTQLFTRFSPFEVEDQVLFEDRIRFVLTGLVSAVGGNQPREFGPGVGGGGGSEPPIIDLVSNTTWSEWVADRVTSTALDVAGAGLGLVEMYLHDPIT